MAITPKLNATLLQFLHQFTAHTLSFGVTFQSRPQLSARTSATWKTQIQYCSWRSQEEQRRKCVKLIGPVYHVFWLWSADLLFGPAVQKEITLTKTGDCAVASLFAFHALSVDRKNSCQFTHEQETKKIFWCFFLLNWFGCVLNNTQEVRCRLCVGSGFLKLSVRILSFLYPKSKR